MPRTVIALLNVAEGAANEVSSILQPHARACGAVRQRHPDINRTFLYKFGIQALSSEIDRIASRYKLYRQELLSTTAGRFGLSTGAGSGAVLWVDANHTVGIDSITITIDTLTTGAIGVGTFGAAAGATMSYLTDQLSAVNAISALDNAINSVNTMRSNMAHT